MLHTCSHGFKSLRKFYLEKTLVQKAIDIISFQCPFHNALQKVDEAITPWRKQSEETITAERTEIKSFENIPGPKGLPIVGTLFDYMKKDGLKFNKMHEVRTSWF